MICLPGAWATRQERRQRPPTFPTKTRAPISPLSHGHTSSGQELSPMQLRSDPLRSERGRPSVLAPEPQHRAPCTPTEHREIRCAQTPRGSRPTED